MVSPLAAFAFVLLVSGVAGSLTDRIPGPILSLAGVYTYWMATGLSTPSLWLLGALTVVGLLALLGDVIGDTIASRVGEVSDFTATIAGVVGSILYSVFGPLGLVLGTALTTFLIEFLRQGDPRSGLAAVVAVLVRSVAARAVKTLFTLVMLATMVVVALL
jgi:uncharacterized protein YqgC (DUF456 family)